MVENEQLHNESIPKMVCEVYEVDRAEMESLSNSKGNLKQKNTKYGRFMIYGVKEQKKGGDNNKAINLFFFFLLNNYCIFSLM